MTREQCIELMIQMYKIGYRLGELKALGEVLDSDLNREAKHQSESLFESGHLGLTIEEAYKIAYGHELLRKG